MCLAIPGRIISISGEDPLIMAQVDFIGLVRSVCISTVDADVGDYVIVHAGTAISVIEPADALETIRDLETIKDYEDGKL